MTRTRSITADKTAMDAAPSDEKGLFLTVKSEVIDTDMKSDMSNFGVMLESPVQAFGNPSLPPAPLVPSGLQRSKYQVHWISVATVGPVTPS